MVREELGLRLEWEGGDSCLSYMRVPLLDSDAYLDGLLHEASGYDDSGDLPCCGCGDLGC